MSALTRAAGALAGWKGYAAAALAGGLALGAAAWTAQSWRYGERLAVQHAAQADEVAEGQRQAREILAQRHAAVAEINERNQRAEWAAYGGMRNAQIQDDGLRADVDAGANGCTSVPSAPAPAVECPTPAPPPAWIMEPAPNLIPLLDRIISPSGRESSE
ncbi:Rz1 family lipoprotein [Achromobacter xylosoxidans]